MGRRHVHAALREDQRVVLYVLSRA